ncbi:VCBS repeat-containing protein [Arenibacter palladensis]|uniref:FG-GAP repeat domain-containing protein n=1 Tax=Arenibacter palladensis TaxID=237373 RepID=UPI002FD4B285
MEKLDYFGLKIQRVALKHITIILCYLLTACSTKERIPSGTSGPGLQIVKYNNPDAISFLGVGLWAWPIPMDYDEDGDMDLLVSCPDTPFNGIYFFENTTGDKFPIFEPPVRLGSGIKNVQVSHLKGNERVTIPGVELVNFKETLGSTKQNLFPVDSILKDFGRKPRYNQWKILDYDNDGDEDIVIGVSDWSDYGWDDAYDKNGKWTKGPLHGYIYLIENSKGTYVNKGRIMADGKEIDVYGAPSPNFADFDGDGDLDLICGEFLDKFTWFENIGTKEEPVYAEGEYLSNEKGVITMDLQMIIPVVVDWDQDGDPDLVVGDEDGRVALMENTGKVRGSMPLFENPVYFEQKADNLKFGTLATPVGVDWDDDGDEDIITGNSAGYFAFIENLNGLPNPKWAPPVILEVDGEPIRILAGANGSIQGPAEAKWGYTTLSVADWDGDGLKDIIFNSIWGRIEWMRNVGSKGNPILSKPKQVKITWGTKSMHKPSWNWWDPKPDELVSQWRTTPYAIDWNNDNLMDLIMLDHEGYLAFFERIEQEGNLYLLPGKRIFYCNNASEFNMKNVLQNESPGLLRLNSGKAGKSGRRKISFIDWDNDGDLDILVNSKNVSLFENTGVTEELVNFHFVGPVSKRILAGHTTSPTFVDWDNNGKPELLIGAEDGHFYYLKR